MKKLRSVEKSGVCGACDYWEDKIRLLCDDPGALLDLLRFYKKIRFLGLDDLHKGDLVLFFRCDGCGAIHTCVYDVVGKGVSLCVGAILSI